MAGPIITCIGDTNFYSFNCQKKPKFDRKERICQLPYSQKLVGLEGEAPEGVELDVFDGKAQDFAVADGVCHVARLEEVPGGRERGPGRGVHARGKDQLHFIGLFQNYGAVALEAWHLILRAQRNPVYAGRHFTAAVGLHVHRKAGRMEGRYQLFIGLQGRFSARKADTVASTPGGGNSLYNLIGRHFLETGMVRVAERALQIAPAKPDKHHRSASPEPFPLQGIEYFVYLIHKL